LKTQKSFFKFSISSDFFFDGFVEIFPFFVFRIPRRICRSTARRIPQRIETVTQSDAGRSTFVDGRRSFSVVFGVAIDGFCFFFFIFFVGFG
jgi:hypothetical protein